MTIKELRAASKMTQKAFSEYVGVNKSTVEKWEYGKPECPEYVRKLIQFKMLKEGIIMNEKITYRATKDLNHKGWNEETDCIIVEPPFDFGDWLDLNGCHSIYDDISDTYIVVDEGGERTGEEYQIICREKTDEDLIG